MDDSNGQSDLGLIGLGVMGRSLALNLESHGFSVSCYNVTQDLTLKFSEDPRVKGGKIRLCGTLDEFLSSLARPRKVWLMIKAGQPVDDMLQLLLEKLEKGDVIWEGGNSHYTDTERRQQLCARTGVHFLGCGVSGGEQGALKGPSLMAGGEKEAYQLLETALRAIAARTQDGPCVAYLGPGGSGHFTKMVHNGIEYACMQSLAEAYDVLTRGLGYSLKEAALLLGRWNQGDLKSYLLEITVSILRKTDPDTGRPLLDLIKDEGEQKGTGKWVCQTALDLGVPVPSISAAVEARFLSSFKPERIRLATALKNPGRKPKGPRPAIVNGLKDLVYLSQMAAFCQGLQLLSAASKESLYRLDLAEVLRIWKGGCIIRSGLLDPLRKLYFRQMDLANPLFNPSFAKGLNDRLVSAFKARQALRSSGLSLACLDASLNYILALSTARLPTGLIQAQRDYFGSHGYRRLDKEGTFHTSW